MYNTRYWNELNILPEVSQHKLCSSKWTAASTQESGGMLNQHLHNETKIELSLQLVIILQSFGGQL